MFTRKRSFSFIWERHPSLKGLLGGRVVGGGALYKEMCPQYKRKGNLEDRE